MKSKSGNKSEICIIPKPVSLVRGEGSFLFDSDTVLVANECTSAAAAALADTFRPAAGFILKVTASLPKGRDSVFFALDPSLKELGDEGYRLVVANDRVTLAAPTQAGLFYAVQTLRQMLPPEIFSQKLQSGVEWGVPCAEITDYPRFAWRGLMLDTGHDFQRLSYIFRFIDLMAMHKFNVLHWHICDLGTFPLEIRGYPELQNPAHLGKREKGNPPRPVKHGFYTQDEARAVVAYAAERHITVLPEIDMPGHSQPVLLAYPEFDCPVPMYEWHDFERWEYCIGGEKAIAFIEEVLTQVMAIFPSELIHIGGDECPSTHWETCPVCQEAIKAQGLKDVEELRRSFLLRIERFLAGRGRRMIGWDELFENGVKTSTAIMAWRPKVSLTAPAAKAGHDVVVASASHLYFDYSETTTPVEKVYSFEPVPAELTAEQADKILGAQAQLWSDNHPTEEQIDRLVYPRACAAAEVVWSGRGNCDWADFAGRLRAHAPRLSSLDIHIPLPESDPRTAAK